MSKQLQPWQPLPDVHCERCDRQATWRVTAGTAWVDPDAADPTIFLGSDPYTASVLTCDDHQDTVSDELCDQYGGSNAEPLRQTWRQWLSGTWAGRPFERAAIRRHNRRWDRALACPHTPDFVEHRIDYCEKCNLERI
jgi:hypothetical protein